MNFISLCAQHKVRRTCTKRSKSKIIIISLDRTNNLLFRFIDLAPSKRDCSLTRLTRMNTASNEERTNFSTFLEFSFHIVLLFFVSYANPFYEVNCIMHTAPIRWGEKVNCIFIIVRRTKHVPISTAAYMYIGHVCNTLLHTYYIDTCDHAF